MNLTHKPELQETRQNWQFFWQGKLGRPAIAAIVPKPDAKVIDKPGFGSAYNTDYRPYIGSRPGRAAMKMSCSR